LLRKENWCQVSGLQSILTRQYNNMLQNKKRPCTIQFPPTASTCSVCSATTSFVILSLTRHTELWGAMLQSAPARRFLGAHGRRRIRKPPTHGRLPPPPPPRHRRRTHGASFALASSAARARFATVTAPLPCCARPMAAAAVGRLAREDARARMAKQWRNHEEARAAR
jgi:hypothetical protein